MARIAYGNDGLGLSIKSIKDKFSGAKKKAAALLKKETLESEEFEKLVGSKPALAKVSV